MCEGTLLGNGIVLSCYSLVKDHRQAHQWLLPVRLFYRCHRWITSSFAPVPWPASEGIPSFLHLFFRMASSVYPSAFHVR